MTARFEREITLWDAVAGSHLIVIATFGVAPNGVTAVEELALMVVTETWIPIEHIYDANLVNALTEDRRRFIKALRYNLPGSQPLAAAVLWTPSSCGTLSSRRARNRRACARSTPRRRVPSPLGFGRQARAPCRRFPSESC